MLIALPVIRPMTHEQPRVMAWIDNDEPLTSDGASHEEYYENGILSRENPACNTGCSSCYLRAWPHFADRRQPDGRFLGS